MPHYDEAAPPAARFDSLISAQGLHPARVRMDLRDLLSEDPAAFLTCSISAIARGVDAGHAAMIAGLLWANGMILTTVSNPSACSLADAIAMCRAVQAVEPSVDIHLARLLGDGTESDSHRINRILELLTIISSGARVMPQLMQLLRNSNARVRSKAMLMIGKAKKDVRWLDPYLSDPDARTRSNAVEALWGSTGHDAIQIFHKFVFDPHHRVAANACVGLHLAGCAEAVIQLEQMAGFSDPMFQAAAAWAMGETGDPAFVTPLQQMAKSAESSVRRAALRGLAAIRKRSQEGSPAK